MRPSKTRSSNWRFNFILFLTNSAKKKKTKSLAKGFAFELKIKKKKLIVAKKNQYITFIPKTTYVIDVHGDT